MEDDYSMWQRREVLLDNWLAARPRCCYCDEAIQDDICYEINDELYCPQCVEEHFKRFTEDLCEN